MNETIYIKHLWQLENVIKGYQYHRENLNYYRFLTPIYVFLGIVGLMLGLYGLIVHFKIKYIILIAYSIFCLSINKIYLLAFIRRCKRLNYEGKQLEWEVNRDVIAYRLENLFRLKLEWEFIKVVIDTPDGFLIYPRPNSYYWLPKTAFSNAEDIAYFVFIAQDRAKRFERIV